MPRHSRNARRRPLIQSLRSAAELCELRQLLSAISAPIDGVGNNEFNPEWGSTDEELLRIAAAEYADGVSEPAGATRASAREVSNAVVSQTESEQNDRGLTDLTWLWGQFIDHDIDLSNEADPAEELHIEVPEGDPFFDPFGTGEVTIDIGRSDYVEGSASSDGVRQQLNSITAFIDGSVVYGSTEERAAALRTFEGGLLKTSEGDLLPFNEDGLDNAGGTSDSLFLAGDVRANENAGLSSMHTLFVREHNRIATELAAEDPTLTDQQLYEQARSIVAAEIQAITFNEFLPALFGPDALTEYSGYDASVNPGIANEFSTAAYRFGHTMLSSELLLLDTDAAADGTSTLELRDAFFNPQFLVSNGIDSLLQGASAQIAQEIDTQVVDDVRNFLFGPPGAGGFDLASLNIERGREHGLADYNDTRLALGLPAVEDFSDITSDAEIAAALATVYGSVDDVDLWVGGLAEDHISGTSMGETFTTIIIDQFERLRDGDRFWYENIFSGEMLETLQNTRLSDIITRNTNVESLQTNAFFAPGFEPVVVDLPADHQSTVDVRMQNESLVVVDRNTGETLLQRPVGDVGSLTLRGGIDVRDNVSVSAGIPRQAVPLGIQLQTGSGGSDTLTIVGTPGDDKIIVAGNSLHANDVDVVFESVSELLLSGEAGNDHIVLESPSNARVTLDGGEGDDRLEGSSFDEYLFGGPGNDVLLGGDGNDELSGGPGNDRLLGQGGLDDLIGNGGDDLLMEESDEQSLEALAPQALFLDTQLNLRSTGDDYLNWGGANEKWLYSDEGWLFITPEGNLYRWDGSRQATGELIASLNSAAWETPELLHATTQDFTDSDRRHSLRRLAHELDSRLHLRKAGSYYENWGGENEKWLIGNSEWYFITPEGRLYQWNGSSRAEGTLLAELDASFHADPRRLFDTR